MGQAAMLCFIKEDYLTTARLSSHPASWWRWKRSSWFKTGLHKPVGDITVATSIFVNLTDQDSLNGYVSLSLAVWEQTIICNKTFWLTFSISNIGSNLLTQTDSQHHTTVLFYIPPTLSYTTTTWFLRVCSFPRLLSSRFRHSLWICSNVTWHRVTRKKYIEYVQRVHCEETCNKP